MIQPESLQKGDVIALIATAKKINPGEIDGAIALMESWGLKVACGPHLYAAHHQFAGTDAERASDLQWAIDHPEAKAVVFARGGYGTVRVLDHIDWNHFVAHPKWLCGFSDLTVLHSHVLVNLGVETLHSSMPIFFKDGKSNASSDSLKRALFGELSKLEWESDALNRKGTGQGICVGGNLSVLYSISGSVSEVDFEGKVLFLEDLTEYLYHLDRMMMQMKRSGQLSELAGLVVGQFSEMSDNPVPFGKTAEEIILEACSEYDFPIAFNAPIGHVEHNESVFHGRSVTLEVGTSSVLTF